MIDSVRSLLFMIINLLITLILHDRHHLYGYHDWPLSYAVSYPKHDFNYYDSVFSTTLSRTFPKWTVSRYNLYMYILSDCSELIGMKYIQQVRKKEDILHQRNDEK
jgi:hypothetical protein